MNRCAAFACWICLPLVLIGMACRLLWLASGTETGFTTLRHQWRDATIGWVSDGHAPIYSREPVEQAEFWLGVVDRVMSTHPDSAHLAVGAALVLDGPAPDFAYSYMRMRKVSYLPQTQQMMFGLDDDAYGIQEAEDAFESQCKDRCLELAACATTLDPTDVEWWRLRALLLWRYSLYSFRESARCRNWVEILDECARHDPDNALYDYLATAFYWESSAELNNALFVIEDADRFQRGVRCFERGQSKPLFAVGDHGFSALAQFLRNTGLPATEHEPIVNRCAIRWRYLSLLQRVSRWQGLRAAKAAAAGDLSSALAIQRQNTQLLSQFTSASSSAAHNNEALACRLKVTAQLNRLANKHRDLLNAKELAEFNAMEEDARLDQKVIEQAARRRDTPQPDWATGIVCRRPTNVLPEVAVGMLPSLAVVFLVIGIAAIGVIRLSKCREVPKLGFIAQSLAFVAASVVTVVAFGLAPSGVINGKTQAWALTFLVITTPIVVSYVALNVLERRKFRFSLRALLVTMSMLCVLIGLVSVSGPNAKSFTTIPFDLSIPAREVPRMDAISLGLLSPPPHSRRWVSWTVLEWTQYHGQYLTVAIWVGFVAMIVRFKMQRAQCEGDGISVTGRDQIGAVLQSLRPTVY